MLPWREELCNLSKSFYCSEHVCNSPQYRSLLLYLTKQKTKNQSEVLAESQYFLSNINVLMIDTPKVYLKIKTNNLSYAFSSHKQLKNPVRNSCQELDS